MAKTCNICMSEIEINHLKGKVVNKFIDMFHTCDDECKFVILNCHHYFHYECLAEWFEVNPSCPTCRDETIIVIPYCTFIRYRRYSSSCIPNSPL